MTDVVWAEESKNGLRFEIRPSYDDAPTMSPCQADGQSSCTITLLKNEMVQRQRLFKVPSIVRHNNPLTNIHYQIFGQYFRSGAVGSEGKCWVLWTGNGRNILLSPKMGPFCGQTCNSY